MTLSLQHFFYLGLFLFVTGIFGVLTRRNVIGILMSIELMFNGAMLNFLAFNRYLHPERLWGQGFVVFVVTIAAAEAVVGLALVLAVYRNRETVYVEKMNVMKG